MPTFVGGGGSVFLKFWFHYYFCSLLLFLDFLVGLFSFGNFKMFLESGYPHGGLIGSIKTQFKNLNFLYICSFFSELKKRVIVGP